MRKIWPDCDVATEQVNLCLYPLSPKLPLEIHLAIPTEKIHLTSFQDSQKL